LRLGWPAEDFAGYVDGQAHDISLVQKDWKIRPIDGKYGPTRLYGMYWAKMREMNNV
jgi:DNA excision repair protein ERCC-3